MPSNPWEESPRAGPWAARLAIAGAALAVVSLPLAAATGEPWLGASGVNGWLVAFAAGLLAALVALPFGLELLLRARQPDRDRRWELALVLWAVLGAALLAVALMVGPGTGSLAAAASLIAALESAAVLATVAVWLLAGG